MSRVKHNTTAKTASPQNGSDKEQRKREREERKLEREQREREIAQRKRDAAMMVRDAILEIAEGFRGREVTNAIIEACLGVAERLSANLFKEEHALNFYARLARKQALLLQKLEGGAK